MSLTRNNAQNYLFSSEQAAYMTFLLGILVFFNGYTSVGNYSAVVRMV